MNGITYVHDYSCAVWVRSALGFGVDLKCWCAMALFQSNERPFEHRDYPLKSSLPWYNVET
jgi:hypothetical protein